MASLMWEMEEEMELAAEEAAADVEAKAVGGKVWEAFRR